MVLSAYAREELRRDGDLALYRGRHPDREDEPSILLLTSRSKRGSPSVDTGARHKCRDFVTPAERLAARFGEPIIRARARSLLCVLTSSQTQTRKRGGFHARKRRSDEA